MHKNFHISIKAVIIRNNKALILKRFNSAGKQIIYELPGGRIDANEFIKDAFKRELFEEIGVTEFALGQVIFAFERETYRTQGVSLMNLFYKVDIKKSEIKLGRDHQDYLWVSKKELEELVGKGEDISNGIIKALNLAFG